VNKEEEYMSYATGHNSFTSQSLLNINIYCRFCGLCIINVEKRKKTVDDFVREKA
jgi:hypothetical protein